ncbi:DUF2946 domain-containing protein [Azoarcus sp. TTM-91]|uniref:DUF2946 family protein n=1 Tax=Azoarcus sp. TTM-91 TaxID=2691581 RepID=UPI00145CDC4C|nr:DUF2946 family protein [Azoarcus sp. TTM-91]NMG34043.1 DUF2946 domain-containing protein [Azoarcus sp. TTM-91]
MPSLLRLSACRQRFVSWLAFAAILLAALAPAVNAALAEGGGTIDICTAAGVVHLPGEVLPGEPAKALAGGEHCPYCVHKAAFDALPAAPWLPAAPPADAGFERSQAPIPQVSSSAWPTARPRAPPALG